MLNGKYVCVCVQSTFQASSIKEYLKPTATMNESRVFQDVSVV